MKKISARMWATLILIGFVGQLAWTIENMYFNVFLYNTIFIHLPGQSGGQTVLPKINSSMPDGATWQRQVVAFGWQNSLYGSTGATASALGSALSPAPTIAVDKANRTINFDFPSASLGRPDGLDGIQFYVTTWDLDGLSSSYRPLNTTPGPWNFSGGTSQDPLIWDDLPLISLSESR